MLGVGVVRAYIVFSFVVIFSVVVAMALAVVNFRMFLLVVMGIAVTVILLMFVVLVVILVIVVVPVRRLLVSCVVPAVLRVMVCFLADLAVFTLVGDMSDFGLRWVVLYFDLLDSGLQFFLFLMW